jgi:hypothetical protein
MDPDPQIHIMLHCAAIHFESIPCGVDASHDYVTLRLIDDS